MSIVTQNSVLGRIKKSTGESPKQVPERLPGSGVDFLRNDFNDGFKIRKNQKDTDFILAGFPRTNFIDSRGNTTQEFTINKPFDLSIDKNNSRLLKLHNDEFNFKEYYAQAKGSGELGARRSSRGFTEPFVIRDVGDQWGERISPTDAFPTAGIVRGGIATHIDRSFAAAQRVGKFLLTPRGIVFTAKQALLQTQVQLEQAKNNLEIKKLYEEAQIKKMLMEQEFQYNMQIQGIEKEKKSKSIQQKEDRKDKRTKIQATQQSQLIDQRKNNKPPKNFESAGNDILGGEAIGDMSQFGPR